MSSLEDAMRSGDVLAEAERRYAIIARLLDPDAPLPEGARGLTGTEVKALSLEADRLIHKIVSLRAEKDADAAKKSGGKKSDPALGKVVTFDADRYRKSG